MNKAVFIIPFLWISIAIAGYLYFTDQDETSTCNNFNWDNYNSTRFNNPDDEKKSCLEINTQFNQIFLMIGLFAGTLSFIVKWKKLKGVKK